MGDFEPMERMQFLPGWTSGELSFSDCYKQASVAEINGIKIPFLHINHLLDNKNAVNRPKEQVDVLYLEKVNKLREEG